MECVCNYKAVYFKLTSFCFEEKVSFFSLKWNQLLSVVQLLHGILQTITFYLLNCIARLYLGQLCDYTKLEVPLKALTRRKFTWTLRLSLFTHAYVVPNPYSGTRKEEIAGWDCTNIEDFKLQKGCKSIIKVMHMTSVLYLKSSNSFVWNRYKCTSLFADNHSSQWVETVWFINEPFIPVNWIKRFTEKITLEWIHKHQSHIMYISNVSYFW